MDISVFRHFFCLYLFAQILSANGQNDYGMYVWQKGWDPSIQGCNSNTAFLEWNLNSECFTDTWSTSAKREWLWSTCSRNDRPIRQLFLYGTGNAISTRDCGNPQVAIIKQTMSEGHIRIPGMKIHALFSDGGDNVPESRHVLDVVWYNSECADYSRQEHIDGVAVNNENWDRTWSAEDMRSYLNALDVIRINAETQKAPLPKLETHFSIGWIWGKDSNNADIVLDWKGKSQKVLRHFIDIFDRLDVQVAFITPDAMESRLKGAEWDYAQSVGKPLMTTIYINKAEPCQTTFFPFPLGPDCPAWSHELKNELQMFRQLDEFQGLVETTVILHHFRGAYSTGMDNFGWPKH